tara:strand:- start:482 stop:1507 length:1026 start_codon:yes stop_codon:yes gene_type:complete
MKVLITGGCGFVGSNLAIYLKSKGFDVESLDNLFRNGSKLNNKNLKNKGIHNYKFDISDFSKIKKLKKYDLIIDCCAEASVEASRANLDRVINTNFIGTLNILKKCIADKSNIIFLSSSRVYSIKEINKLFKNHDFKKEISLKKKIDTNFSTFSPKSIYGFTKLGSEDLIKELSFVYNLKYIINRFGVISGPGQMGKEDQGFVSLWVWRHINKLPLKYIGFKGFGNQKRDILHIQDACELIHTQILNFKKKYNLTLSAGGGEKNLISLKYLTEVCKKITGNKCKISKSYRTSIYDIPYFCSSNHQVKKLYNWEPKKNIFDIVKDIFNWQTKDQKILRKFLS